MLNRRFRSFVQRLQIGLTCTSRSKTSSRAIAFVGKLPDEILLIILEIVYECFPAEDFTNCLVTSQQWFSVGIRLNWRQFRTSCGYGRIICYDEGFPLPEDWIIEKAPLIDKYIHLIRDFSVNLNPPGQASSTLSETVRWGFPIADMLPKFNNLVTFSLHLSNTDRRTALFRQSMAALVLALPDSVRNLELCFGGNDSPCPKDSSLCVALNQVLPRLDHIRLEMSCICPTILIGISASSPARLRTAAFTHRHYTYHTRRISSNSPCCEAAVDSVLAFSDLSSRFDSLIGNGSLPRAKHIVIVGPKEGATKQSSYFRIVPVAKVTNFRRASLNQPWEQSVTHVLSSGKGFGYLYSHHPWQLPQSMIQETIEGPSAWSTGNYSVRLPPDYPLWIGQF